MDSLLNAPHLLTIALSMGAASLVWWWRERRLTRLRQCIATLQAISEEVLTARSAEAMQQTLANTLPSLLDGASPCLWLANPDTGALEPVAARAARVPLRNETDPLVQAFRLAEIKRAEPAGGLRLLFPMRCEGQPAGVLELNWGGRSRRIHPDEQAALGHLANQAAIALRLLDQGLLREQVLRGERLGAVGQLLAGVAEELQDPIEEIARLATRLQAGDPNHDQFRALHQWSESALHALDRLVAFGRPSETRVRPVDLAELLRKLAHFRERTWSLRLVRPLLETPPEPILVLGSYGQLEQALLCAILRAEELLPAEGDRTLRIGLHHDDAHARALIEFPINAPPAEWGLSVAQAIAGNHGGLLRLGHEQQTARFELELPLHSAPATAAEPDQARSLTLLLLASGPEDQRPLIEQLAARHHRVVPVDTEAEAFALIGRFRFDALLAGGPSWKPLLERTRKRLPAFILLADGDESPAADPAVLVLHRPVDPSELTRILHEAGLRSQSAAQ